MSAGDLIGLGGLALVGLGLFLQFGVGLFHLGKHSQRIAALEERTRDSGAAQASIAVLTSTVAALREQIEDMRQDIKHLLTGRIRPAARSRDDA